MDCKRNIIHIEQGTKNLFLENVQSFIWRGQTKTLSDGETTDAKRSKQNDQHVENAKLLLKKHNNNVENAFRVESEYDGKCPKTLEGHKSSVCSVAILGPDRIVSGSADYTVKIWNTDGECLKTLEGHSDRVSSVAILGPDRIVSGSSDDTVKIWNTDGKRLKTLKATVVLYIL